MAVYVLTREGQAGAADPLVQRAQNGDLRAFEQLLERRFTSLLRLAIAIVGDELDARDAIQQALENAWRELPRLREVERFDAWLNRILTNACRTTVRSRRRRRVREIAVSELDPDRGADFAATPTQGPADRTEQLDLLERAFDRLDVGQRTLLALHHLHERSVAEIAAELRLPATTVKWRLHRARAALVHALELERR
jgi:RNA polymerase sigma-70 factor (ECF subfamily)